MSINNGRNGGDTPPDGGDITSTMNEIPPLKQPENERHFDRSGDIGGSGDIFRLPLDDSSSSTTVTPLDGV
jgi:hypothetical protein